MDERDKISAEFIDLLKSMRLNKIIARLPVKFIFAILVPGYGVLYFHRRHKISKGRNSRLGFLFFRLNYILNGVDIHSNATIGVNAHFFHPVGVVIGGNSVIGSNAKIHSNVILGTESAVKKDFLYPVIGDNCYIGTGAVIVGGIRIGNNVVIGANSLVLQDVSDNAVVAGAPAKILRYIDPKQDLT